jgi:hypothetical protein
MAPYDMREQVDDPFVQSVHRLLREMEVQGRVVALVMP